MKYLIMVTISLAIFGCNGRSDEDVFHGGQIDKMSGEQEFIKNNNSLYFMRGDICYRIQNYQSVPRLFRVTVWADEKEFPFSKLQMYEGDVFLGTSGMEMMHGLQLDDSEKIKIPVTIITSKSFINTGNSTIRPESENPMSYFLDLYRDGQIAWKGPGQIQLREYHVKGEYVSEDERKSDPDVKDEKVKDPKSDGFIIKSNNTYTETKKF